MERIRLGAVRVLGSVIRLNPPWFAAFIDEIDDLNKYQALGQGGYSDAVDYIGIHPQFEAIDDDGGPIPVYTLIPDSDGRRAKVKLIQGRDSQPR